MPEAWVEVLVAVPQGWQELVAEVLSADEDGLPAGSVAFGPPSLASDEPPAGCEWLRSYYPVRDDSAERRARITQALLELGTRSGEAELASLRARFRLLPPEDYARSWEKSWHPFRVGRLCVQRPKDASRARPGERVLRLEPGGVFGTGRHATTRMCLHEIEAALRPGERVLDAGTGTGILAVAAALWGADQAAGFDIDANSPSAAAELAAQNGVQARCRFLRGGFEVRAPGAPLAGDWDGLCANLYSDLLQGQAAALRASLRPGGWFVFSGCPATHEAPTVAALIQAGLVPQRIRARGRWRCFVGRG